MEPINKNKALVESKIKTMIKNGRKEITTLKELKEYPIGTLISYMNTKGVYRTAGCLIKVADTYFIYINMDTDQKWRVRINTVDRMWVGSVFETQNDLISIVPTDKEETSTPVMIGKIPIYYAKNGYDYDRYTCTKKYKYMEKWDKLFGQS